MKEADKRQQIALLNLVCVSVSVCVTVLKRLCLKSKWDKMLVVVLGVSSNLICIYA